MALEQYSIVENTVRDRRVITPISALDIGLSFVICFVTSSVFMILDPNLPHPCVLPLFICGVIIGPDAIRWFRGGVDTFDPKGIIGVFGLNFFFLAPLLVLYFKPEIAYIHNPSDWRPWIGVMGWFNVAGVMMYQLGHFLAFRRRKPSKKVWILNARKATITVWAAIVFSIVCWVLYLIMVGGFAGIMAEKLYVDVAIGGVGTFKFMAAALMPLLLIALTIRRSDNTRASIFFLFIVLLSGLIIQFLTAGLAGSRLRVLSPLIWAAGIVHYYWHDLTQKVLVLLMIPVILFTFIYGMYKRDQERFIDMLRGQTAFAEVTEATGESIPHVLVHDVSRANIQAWMMYRWFELPRDYSFRYGTTYLQAPIALAPKWLFRFMQKGGSWKTRAGTEYMRGKGYFEPLTQKKSTHIYGLAGEAILNFGLWAIPFAFAFWGFLVGWLRKKWLSWPMGDCRLLIMPWLSLLSISILLVDSDVVWGIITSQVMIPGLVVFLISSRNYFHTETKLEGEAAPSLQTYAEVS